MNIGVTPQWMLEIGYISPQNYTQGTSNKTENDCIFRKFHFFYSMDESFLKSKFWYLTLPVTCRPGRCPKATKLLPVKLSGLVMEDYMNTAGTGLDKCSYCGAYHSYSREMCKDMIIRRGFRPLTNDEIDDLTLANEGLKSYAKGLAKEDSI